MGKQRTTPDHHSHPFGRMVRALRRARGLTQEALAERSGLSADTIRRMEHGDFSPSLYSVAKLVTGLRLDLSTLFAAFDLADRQIDREILAMARSLTRSELAVALRVLAFLAELVGKIAATEGGEDLGPVASTLDREGDDGQ